MTLIGLVSDTHIVPERRPLPGERDFFRFPSSSAGTLMPAEVVAAMRRVDLILHAGDVYTPGVLDQLERVAPVICALGNGDRTLAGDRRVKRAHVVEVAGLAIGVIHGTIEHSAEQEEFEKFRERFFGRPLDVLVCGDTHVPLVVEHWGLLLVNPGSATIPRGLTGPGTVGLLHINGQVPRAEIVQLSW